MNSGRHRWRMAVVGLFVTLGFVLAQPLVASAYDYQYQNWSGHTYVSYNDCPYMSATIQDWGGLPHMTTYGSLDWYGNGRSCGNTGALMYSYFVVRQDLYKWTGSQWALCNQGPWIYNSPNPRDPSTGVNIVHSIQTDYGWSNPPCGPGYYDQDATAQYDYCPTSAGCQWDGNWYAPGYIYTA